MATGHFNLGDGVNSTVNLEIVLGENGFEFGSFDVVGAQKYNKKAGELRDFGRTDKITDRDFESVDKIWLGNTSRVLDGADSKEARKDLGHKMDVEDLLAIISGDIEDDNILVEENEPGEFTIKFVNAKNPNIVDTMNISIPALAGSVSEVGASFINDDANSQSTVVFASESANSGALLGYNKDSGGSNAKAGLAYEVVGNSVPGAEKEDVNGDNKVQMLNPDRNYSVELVQETAFSETYAVTNGRTKKGEPAVDTITFIDDVDGNGGLFDLEEPTLDLA